RMRDDRRAQLRFALVRPRVQLASQGGRELYTRPDQSEAELRATIVAHADTIYHPVGTCRMGSDARAVV
ncbi:GMC oxidoreductase, partial [Burkholderia cenocepacia]|nr:GMC oxidoreductase [Burkholderia cenocepacia]